MKEKAKQDIVKKENLNLEETKTKEKGSVKQVEKLEKNKTKTDKIKTVKNQGTSKQAEKSTKIVFQYQGNEIDTEKLVEQIKQSYEEKTGMAKKIKSLELYIKPEENAAYYVVNKVPSGFVPLF